MDRLYYLTATFPTGTPLSSPFSVPFPLEDNDLIYVDINVPPGPSGLMGFRFLWAGQQIIPWGNNSFLVTDNEKIHVDTNTYMTQTGLVIQGYNTDIFNHSIYIRALIRNAETTTQAPASELTGNIALPAGLDQSGLSQASSLTAADFSVSDAQLSADQVIGSDNTVPDIVTEFPPEEPPAEITPTAPIVFTPQPITLPPSGISVVSVSRRHIEPVRRSHAKAHVRSR